MTTLIDLPTEVLAVIVSLIDIRSALRCQRVCKVFHQVASSEIVCKALCHRAGYLGEGQSLQDLRKPLLSRPLITSSTSADARDQCDGEKYSAWKLSGRDDAELESYKTLLTSSWKLDYVKDNADLSKAGGCNYSDETEPWRIKIDPIDRLIFASSSCGPRMHTIDMDTGYTAMTDGCGDYTPCGHLEYDQGWAVYTTRDDSFHISCSERNLNLDRERNRAFLFPHGRLKPAHTVRAYRLIFPHLLSGSDEGYLTLYNIVNKETVLDVPLRRRPNVLNFSIKYVEFDDDYLWVILASSIGSPGLLETYCRRTGRFLWEISPRSQIARWPSHWNFCSAGLCGEQATAACSHSQPGRQAVVFHSIEDCGSDPIIRLLDWDAVHPDPKTGSLCLLSGHSLAIFPGYKSFADHTDDEGQIDRNVATDNTVFIQDGSVKEGRDLPPWMRERGGDPDSYLAVADGRAAFIAKNGVALVNIPLLLFATRGIPHAEYEARDWGLKRMLDESVSIYSSPYVFKSDMFRSSCLAMTSTHLAWVGSYQAIEQREVNHGELTACGPPRVYHSEQRPSVIWIDFGQLRENKEDTRRLEEEKGRAEALEACRVEMERRIAINGGKYPLRSGRSIQDATKHYKDPLDTVAILLNLGEFADLRRWIDPDRVKKAKGTKAAINKFYRLVTKWNRNARDEEDWPPFAPSMRHDHLAEELGGEDFDTDDDWHGNFGAGHGFTLLDLIMNGSGDGAGHGGALGAFPPGLLGLHHDDDEDLYEQAMMDMEEDEWGEDGWEDEEEDEEEDEREVHIDGDSGQDEESMDEGDDEDEHGDEEMGSD